MPDTVLGINERQSPSPRELHNLREAETRVREAIKGQKGDKGGRTVIPREIRDGFPKEVTCELKWKDLEKLGLSVLQRWNQARYLLGAGTTWLFGPCGAQELAYLTVLNTEGRS